MVAAAEAVGTGAGILFIVKNYAGDVMNFALAAEMGSSRHAETLVIDDDVAVERSGQGGGRRGVAGTVVVEKLVGAAAEAGAEIGALKRLGASVNSATRSMGVALTSCTVPAVGKPTFDIAGDEMEVGVGIHGEPGRRRVAMMRADEIAEELVHTIVQDLNPPSGCEVLLMVNGSRRDAVARASCHVRRRFTPAREARTKGEPEHCRQLRHVAGHGGMLDYCHGIER